MIRLRISHDLALNKSLFSRGLPWDLWCGDHHTFWVAWDHDEPAGFCSAVLLPRESGAFLSSAVVFRAYRGRRIQRQMIRTRLRWAQRHGAAHVVTYTARDNWESIKSLLTTGFRVYEPDVQWAGRAWYFQCNL